jgi:prevent-host-death family protein
MPKSAPPEPLTAELLTAELPPPGPSSRDAQVSLRDARNQLARLVDAVHQGASVVITKHGRPWVRLVSLANPDPSRRSPGRCLANSSSLDPTALFAVRDRMAVLAQLQRQRRLQQAGAPAQQG